VPRELAARLTQRLDVPTIGIGAGPDCDGQVLVWHDLLGLTPDPVPRFVRRYGQLGRDAVEALRAFADDVRRGDFPDDSESYHVPGPRAAARGAGDRG
jgi:3-methyl-2-oxobutanoate hydroxymethyltransferase